MLPAFIRPLQCACRAAFSCSSSELVYQVRFPNSRLQQGLLREWKSTLLPQSAVRPFSALKFDGRNGAAADFGKPSSLVKCTTTTVLPARTIVTVKDSKGEKIDAPQVVDRFLRLGNGIWIRRNPGYNHLLWRKILKKGGPQSAYRKQRHMICSTEETRILDRLVTDKFKKQRWTVSDPYAGYDDNVKFYYNPFDVPGLNAGKAAERREYMWHRYMGSLRLKEKNKSKHRRREAASNRQKPILRKPYFH